MKWGIALIITALAVFMGASPGHAEDARLASASTRIEQAFHRGNTASLAAIAANLEKAESGAGSGAKYADYYLGYAAYALARLWIGKDNAKADRYVDVAEMALQRALQTDDRFAEAHALLSSTLGMEITLHPFRGMWLGRRATGHLQRALVLAPHSPRIMLAQAISDYHTPSAFGDDKQRAMKELGEALAAFAQSGLGNPLAPRWGEAEAYVLRAQASTEAGDVAAARSDYQAALSLAPDYVAAKTGLARLPEAAAAPPRR